MIISILYLIFSISHDVVSNNGLYQGTIAYGQAMDLNVESFALDNQNRELLYTKRNPDATTFFINNNGIVFALNEKRLHFYELNGAVHLLKELEFPNGFGFSSDNLLFFASDRNSISVYNNEGEIIYELDPGRLFTSTKAGKTIAVISQNNLFIYEYGSRKFTRQLSTPYARKISFSDDGESIIIDEPSGVEIFDCQTGAKKQ